ncbi:MAG: hydrolase [Clostridia bacterium]
MSIEENKARFIEILRENVTRNGVDNLIDWLCRTDFFEAPASTKFHSAYAGGLCQHSLNVYDVFMNKHFDEETDIKESVVIATLLHDLCKANFYKLSKRNQKIDGKWQEVDFYTIEDQFPFGHGEKSVFLIERFMKLKIEEAAGIRWHMGGFDDSVKAGSFSLSVAFEKYPLCVKTHLSDLEASYLHEEK